MGSIKDEANQKIIKKAVSRNTIKDVCASQKQRDESSSSTNATPNKIGAECSESGCSGVLMQSISVDVYKPWLYQCTACAKKFHLH